MEAKLAAGEFTLDDFKGQLRQIMQPGLMMKMLSMMPGMGEIAEDDGRTRTPRRS